MRRRIEIEREQAIFGDLINDFVFTLLADLLFEKHRKHDALVVRFR